MPNQHGHYVIAIDGTSASGKSTLSKQLAVIYDARRIEYSRFFRLIAHYMLEQGFDPSKEPTELEITEAAAFAADLDWIYIETTKDLDLSTLRVADATPYFAGQPSVIASTDAMLRNLVESSSDKPIIVEGRTIGKYTYPESDVKLYVDADLTERAKRRHKEVVARHGSKESVEDVYNDLARRDHRDQTREYQPTGFDEAVHMRIDTTTQTPAASLANARQIIDKVLLPNKKLA